ncbi:short-chain alcohol dehydrogenase [Cyathus striatus]|nr:short-chain alcohol dehydrogenase [Cyathus striatus]
MAKTVFITGCSSGIGLSASKIFQNNGWNVAATMRKPECPGGQELSKLPNVIVLKLDVQDTNNINTAVDAAIAKFGHIDVLVNNAGYSQMGLVETISREKIVKQFDVNVFGVIETMKVILPHIRKNEVVDGSRGAIINVGSGAGEVPFPYLAMYTASKYALHGLTKAMSHELASQNIQSKLIIPHSGVAGTSFIERGGSEFVNPDESLASYGPFTAAVMGKYMSMQGGQPITADDVAQEVYIASTERSDRLHCYIGNDPAALVDNKRKLSEDDFVKYVSTTFGLA